MEKFKMVIKGKYGIDSDGDKSLIFKSNSTGDINALSNALADTLCDIAVENGLELKELMDNIKYTYKRCMKEREDNK